MQYNWPGNIRELKNVIERLATISKQDVILLKEPLEEKEMLADAQSEETKIEAVSQPSMNSVAEAEICSLASAVHKFEVEYIRKGLAQCNGNVTKAAQLLGIHRSAIYRKLR